MNADQLFEAIMALPEEERLDLIDRVCVATPAMEYVVDLEDGTQMSIHDPRFAAEMDRRAADTEGWKR
jgi:hypothetical protein